MRYREELQFAPESARHPSQTIVDITVWFTLVIGILFLVAGVRARQIWLAVWGGLTLIACGVYFFRVLIWP